MAHDDDDPNVLNSIGQVEMVKTQSGVQYRVVRDDGKRIWINPNDYLAYCLTEIARAMNGEGRLQIGKIIKKETP